MKRRGSRNRRGFTFVEVMIVVAIIGVLMALAIAGWRRAGVKRDIHDAVSDIETVVRTARNLASLAGGTIGGGPTELANCTVINGAGAAPAGAVDHISILIDAPNLQVVAPVRLVDNGAGGYTTDCETIDLNAFVSDGLAAELLAGTDPGTAITLAFSQMGRVYIPPGAPAFAAQRWNIGVRTVGGEVGLEEGFQILPSGVLCRRKIAGLAVNSPVACDEN